MGKMIRVVAMATEVAIKILTIIFFVLSGNEHSVNVSSTSRMGPRMALSELLDFLIEMVLSV